MIAKHCSACRRFFMPNKAGLANVFCGPCLVECEEAYHEIRQYLREHPGVSPAMVVFNLKISAVFVNHLFRLGRFATEFSSAKVSQNRQCAVCKRLMEPHEDVYCIPCNQIIEKRLHHRYHNVINGTASPLKQNTSQTNKLINPPDSDKKRPIHRK